LFSKCSEPRYVWFVLPVYYVWGRHHYTPPTYEKSLEPGLSPHTSCSKVHSIQNSNTYAQLFGQVIIFRHYAPWSLHSMVVPLSTRLPVAF